MTNNLTADNIKKALATRAEGRRVMMRRFLDELVRAPLNMAKAASTAGTWYSTVKLWVEKSKDDPDGHYAIDLPDENGDPTPTPFWRCVELAREVAMDQVEHAAFELATVGERKGVWFQGQRVGEDVLTNVKAMELLLRARRREYAPPSVQVTTNVTTVNVEDARSRLAQKLMEQIENRKSAIDIEGVVTGSQDWGATEAARLRGTQQALPEPDDSLVIRADAEAQTVEQQPAKEPRPLVLTNKEKQ